MQYHLTTEEKARFWSRVTKSGKQGCWIWTGTKIWNGYGTLKVAGTTRLAHRIAWCLIRGEIPEGLCVCHNCPGGDNRACVKPLHMFLGTKGDNNRDSVRKGTHVRGERSPKAKLTEGKVREARRRRAGGESVKSLAVDYEIAVQNMRLLLDRRNWRHVEEE